MGKPRRPRSPRPALAPNQPFEGDPQTETALPAEAVGASEIALPPEPPFEAEPAPAFEAALEAATEGATHDAPADTILHVEAAAGQLPTAEPALQDPAVPHEAASDAVTSDEAASEEPVLHAVADDAPRPETVAGEPTFTEAPVQESAVQEPVSDAPVASEPAEAPVAAAEPEPVAPPAVPEPVLPGIAPLAAAFAPDAQAKAAFQFVFLPEPPDFSGIYAAITRYMRGESEAAAAHMRALGEARSPADLIRLQVGEFQRAADASLTCWSTVAHKAGYSFNGLTVR
ncbi:hypothetical protein Q8W71_03485 [Methylobacterium sp. NEAU 140]|uniref:hypothetical protein n=1 Tax=Methylobacterium sp. NEAU 140 TaxID=3064945 RepID=UPI002735300F|nr:hypothetical protein [Methylobacterium sp. NEAU 140]MDP4021676.1 hypothetical protein [Methylobacterium sp. NEAU 140]